MIQIDTITFLQSLYGDIENYYLTLWIKETKQTAWLSINDLSLIAGTAESIEKDIYFGVGLSRTKKTSTNRMSTKDIDGVPGLWIDLDLKDDTHPNNPEDINDLVDFLNDLPLQPSIMVASGHGIHAHWVLKEFWEIESDQERDEVKGLFQGWQDFIRSRAAVKKWKVDSTHDLSRVLRLPGTTNFKYPDNPVEVTVISSNAERYNQDDFSPYKVEIAKTGKRDKFKRNPSDGPASQVIDNCIFMQVCREHAHELSEPQWVAMMSNIARCSDGPEACHSLSKPYPGYSEQETQDKIFHALNDMHPQTCEYIHKSLGFNQCPEGGCGVKAPVGFALMKSKNPPAASDDKPVPDGFFDVAPTDTKKIGKFTDLGNGEYFAAYYEGKVKYCTQMDKWLIWDKTRWVIDGANQIMVLAGKCVRSMYDHISRMDDDDLKKKLFNHAMKSEDVRKLKAMITVAKGYMPVSVDELDQDPWLLNSPTGIIDLKTGQLLPHDPEKNMTKIITARYDPLATCPVFEGFIHSVFDGNKNIIGFMQRFLGYCLTGDTREQQFIIAFGDGRNGKGTLLNLIQEILADYAKATPTDVLYSKKFDKASNDVARLAGARFVLASEGEKGKKFDEPLIKKMTGQDLLAARFLYKETFEFMPQFKLCMMTNDKPVASEDDAALWARIQLVPFIKKFEGKTQDKTLKYRLRDTQELSGILQWLIAGCLEWQRSGLNPPEEVVSATREYRSENDKLKDWMDDCCVVNENVVSFPKELYRSFQSWSLENGERFIMIHKNFVKSLAKRGFHQFPGAGNHMKMRGIALAARTEGGFGGQENPF